MMQLFTLHPDTFIKILIIYVLSFISIVLVNKNTSNVNWRCFPLKYYQSAHQCYIYVLIIKLMMRSKNGKCVKNEVLKIFRSLCNSIQYFGCCRLSEIFLYSPISDITNACKLTWHVDLKNNTTFDQLRTFYEFN